MKDKTDASHTDAQLELETARTAMLDAYASFLEAKKHLKKAALAAGMDFKDSANEQIEVVLTRARDRKDEFQDRTSDYVRDNPLTSAGLAFLAGAVLTKILGK